MGNWVYYDRTGQRFNSWTIVRRSGTVYIEGKAVPLWECRCDCGTVRHMASNRIGPGMSGSCGCSVSLKFKERYAREALRFIEENEIEWLGGEVPEDVAAAIAAAGYVPEGYKRCGHCGKVLPLEKFTHNRNRPDGYGYECRECRRRYNDRVRPHKADIAKARFFGRHSFPGSGRPLPCPVRYANEHADDWMFGDTLSGIRPIFKGWRALGEMKRSQVPAEVEVDEEIDAADFYAAAK